MSQDLFESALAEVEAFYRASPELMAFQTFPEHQDLDRAERGPFPINVTDMIASDQSLASENFARVRDALIAVKDQACWRETYRDTNIG
ncbi:MAG: hypothetical protein AAF412_03090, partial [Pseudomonadota bacterium]